MVCDKVRQVEGLKGWRRISRDTENGKKSRHSMRNSNNMIFFSSFSCHFDFDFDSKFANVSSFPFSSRSTHGNVIHVIHV